MCLSPILAPQASGNSVYILAEIFWCSKLNRSYLLGGCELSTPSCGKPRCTAWLQWRWGMEDSRLLPPIAAVYIKMFHIVAGVIIPGTVTVKLRLK